MQELPILGDSVWAIAKILVLIGIGVYIVFALVVVRQVKIMTDTLEVGFEAPVRLFSLALLVVSILVFLFALTTL